MRQHRLAAAFFAVVVAIALGAAPARASTPTATWRVDSKGGAITELTFHIEIDKTKPVDTWYFSNQFGFKSGGGIGYIGLQPTAAAPDGTAQYRAIFSSFRADSHSGHPNCHGGADGRSNGVSCHLIVRADPGSDNALEVELADGQVTGSVSNPRTGGKTVIGKWTVGPNAGSFADSQASWIENYKMNNPAYAAKAVCNSEYFPFIRVKYQNPTGDNGSLAGTMGPIKTASIKCPDSKTTSHDASGDTYQYGYR